jgi:ankyrin repeat protein
VKPDRLVGPHRRRLWQAGSGLAIALGFMLLALPAVAADIVDLLAQKKIQAEVTGSGIQSGATPTGQANATPNSLLDAAAAGDLSRVQGLLAAKADVNARGLLGVTALIAASGFGHLQVVQALLAAKAEVNAKAGDGTTALFMASQNGHADVAQALLAAKADVNAIGDDGTTAISLARKGAHEQVVKLLIAASP